MTTVYGEVVAAAAAAVHRIVVVVAGLTLILVTGDIVVVIDAAVIDTTMIKAMNLATHRMIAIVDGAKIDHDQGADLGPDQEKSIAAVVIVREKIREGVLNVIVLVHQNFDEIGKKDVTPDDHLVVQKETITEIVAMVPQI